MDNISDLGSVDAIYRLLRSRCRASGMRLLGWQDEYVSKIGTVFFLQATFPNGEYGITAMGFTQEMAVRYLYERMLEPVPAHPEVYRRDTRNYAEAL